MAIKYKVVQLCEGFGEFIQKFTTISDAEQEIEDYAQHYGDFSPHVIIDSNNKIVQILYDDDFDELTKFLDEKEKLKFAQLYYKNKVSQIEKHYKERLKNTPVLEETIFDWSDISRDAPVGSG